MCVLTIYSEAHEKRKVNEGGGRCDNGCFRSMDSCTAFPYYDNRLEAYMKLVKLLLKGENKEEEIEWQDETQEKEKEQEKEMEKEEEEKAHIVQKEDVLVSSSSGEEKSGWMDTLLPIVPALIACTYFCFQCITLF